MGKFEHLDHYSRSVEWSSEDHAWIGYCPDLFPYGAVCHADTSEEAFARLGELIDEEIVYLLDNKQPLPEPKRLVSS